MSLIFDNLTLEGKLILTDNSGGGGGGGPVTAQYLTMGASGGQYIGGAQGNAYAGGTGGVSTGTITISAGKTYDITVGRGGLMDTTPAYFTQCWWFGCSQRSMPGNGGTGSSSFISTGTGTSLLVNYPYHNGGAKKMYVYDTSYSYSKDLSMFNLSNTPQLFTVEAWVKPLANSSMVIVTGETWEGLSQYMLGIGDLTRYYVADPATGSYGMRPYLAIGLTYGNNFRGINQASKCIWGDNDLVIGKWTHLAAVYDPNGTSAKLYQDGKLVASSNSLNPSSQAGGNATYYNTQGNILQLFNSGNINSNIGFQGLIRDLRIVKGSSVYTTEFTPPTQTLTAVTGTVFLTFRTDSTTPTDDSGKNCIIVPNYGTQGLESAPTGLISVAGGGGGGTGEVGSGFYGLGGTSGFPQNKDTSEANPWNVGGYNINYGGAANVTSDITGSSVVYAGPNGGMVGNSPAYQLANEVSIGGSYYATGGVVILAMPTASYTGNVTGSPIVTTTGTKTVLTYTQNGTYIA
jgi:hypothetical protein